MGASADCAPNTDCGAEGASPGAAPLPPPAAPPAQIVVTAEEVATFAAMVNDSHAAVVARLRGEPHLAVMAVDAAEAHDHRKRVGRALMISAITVLAVTDIAGAFVAFATPGALLTGGSNAGQFFAGLVIALVGDVVGLSLAVPGIVKLSAKTDAEKRAIDSYLTDDAPGAPPRPPVPVTTGTVGAIPHPLVFPLLNATF
ncbi:MAG TPA: hypothetical protein VH044_17425 [Polyangiaceae bacterium]|nr:hypothetical protein [Polyangiaceae bacterium]